MSGKGGEDFVPIHSSGQRVSFPSPDVCLSLRARPSVFIQTVPLCTTTTKDLQRGCICIDPMSILIGSAKLSRMQLQCKTKQIVSRLHMLACRVKHGVKEIH